MLPRTSSSSGQLHPPVKLIQALHRLGSGFTDLCSSWLGSSLLSASRHSATLLSIGNYWKPLVDELMALSMTTGNLTNITHPGSHAKMLHLTVLSAKNVCLHVRRAYLHGPMVGGIQRGEILLVHSALSSPCITFKTGALNIVYVLLQGILVPPAPRYLIREWFKCYPQCRC